jgi:hypothetical protein
MGGDRKVRNNAMKMRNNAVLSRFPAAVGSTLLLALLGSPSVADIISDWSTAAAPPPPELKEVAIDPSTTALLFLDIMKTGCSARPSCVEKVQNMIKLHDQARAHNMVVWYSLVGSGGKATPDDIMDAAIKPRAGEWYRQNGPASGVIRSRARL